MVQGVYVMAQRCKITNVSISSDLKLFSTPVFFFTILILQIKWYYYLMLAIVDVEANYIGMSLDTITENNKVLSNISSFFITWVDADLACFFSLSCQGLSVHILDKCDAPGLLGHSLCHSLNLDLLEDKVWVDEAVWRWSLCGWPRIGRILRCARL